MIFPHPQLILAITITMLLETLCYLRAEHITKTFKQYALTSDYMRRRFASIAMYYAAEPTALLQCFYTTTWILPYE